MLKVAFTLSEVFSEPSNLTRVITSILDPGAVLVVGFGVALHLLDCVLETDLLEDHGVGTVQNEREEQCEAAEVHVALGVEFAGLYFGALGAGDRGT